MVIVAQGANLSGTRPKIVFTSYSQINCGVKDVLIHLLSTEALVCGAGLQAIYKKLAQLYPTPVPQLTSLQMISHRIVSTAVHAVTRRLSRETTNFCCCIEIEAKRLLKYFQSIQVERIVINNAEWLDGYTIRVLAAVSRQLHDRQIYFELVFSSDPIRSPIIFNEVMDARRSIWLGFYNIAELQIDLDTALLVTSIEQLESIERFESWEYCLAEITQSLEYAAYDRALYIISRAEGLSLSNNQSAQLYLLRATIHSNLGNQDRSEEMLQKGLLLANDPYLSSRLHYCLGLVLAKRRSDFDGASYNFQIGKQVITDANLDATPQGIVELSWQDNGLALLDSMRARSTNEQERLHFLKEAMEREKTALKRLGNHHTEDADYLRFNLLANCAFLFEMQGQYHQAMELFKRVFGILDKQDELSQTRFRMNYNYRMGVLALKAQDMQFAKVSLQNGLSIAIEIEDAHLETRIGLAVAQMLLMEDCIEEARAEIITRLNISARRSDQEMIKAFNILLEYLENNGTAIRQPIVSLSPKLPAYISIIDLLGSQTNDLNKWLSGSTAQIPRGTNNASHFNLCKS